VLIDSPCGSSCEEFLLAVRQSFNVKLVGQPSDKKARANEVLQVQRWLEGGSLAPSAPDGKAN
jgi:hypothetical protein